MKKILLSSAIVAAFALFTACGDDSSSGPEDGTDSSMELEESSSSVKKDVKSSSSEVESSSSEAKKDKSSSSVKKDAKSSSSEAKSSSSEAKKDKSSSSEKKDAKSSSSEVESSSSEAKKDKSSSSEKKDAKSSSSEAKSSSSEVKKDKSSSSEKKDAKSSSSEVESSSSEAKKDKSSSSEKKDVKSSSSSLEESSSSIGNPYAGRDTAAYCFTKISGDTLLLQYGFDEFDERMTLVQSTGIVSFVEHGPDCDDIDTFRQMLVGISLYEWENVTECTSATLTSSREISALQLGFIGSNEQLEADAKTGFCLSFNDKIMSTEHMNSKVEYGYFIDHRDDHVYKTVKIGDQVWMAQNLNYDPSDMLVFLGQYAWSGCYGNDDGNCHTYGRLYTWEVAMYDGDCAYGDECNPTGDHQGVCPYGWHLPNAEEWDTLISNMGGENEAGSVLKSKSGWNENGNGDDSYGFAVLPAGIRLNTGSFDNLGTDDIFWTSSEAGSTSASSKDFYYENSIVSAFVTDKNIALSVRCVKNAD